MELLIFLLALIEGFCVACKILLLNIFGFIVSIILIYWPRYEFNNSLFFYFRSSSVCCQLNWFFWMILMIELALLLCMVNLLIYENVYHIVLINIKKTHLLRTKDCIKSLTYLHEILWLCDFLCYNKWRSNTNHCWQLLWYRNMIVLLHRCFFGI